jgi:undecaprenyl-diphosphatase
MPRTPWQQINDLDLALCLRCNRLAHFRFWRALFRGVSRFGDGVVWYSLMGVLLLAHGAAALPTVGRMALAGVLGLAIYRWLKTRTSRPRPCEVYAAISAAAPTLDRFSFPSGHTLHAVSFSMVACAAYPMLAAVLYPFAALVAISRPILGLHYPSDVIAGALIGALVAQFVLMV